MDHNGVTVRLDYLGYPEVQHCYLPYSLLKKLYTAFDNMGRYVGILFPGELYEIFISRQFTDEESELMHDERKGCFTLNTYEDEEGYIYLTPLLLELLDMEILEKIVKDPTLDIKIFDRMYESIVLDQNIWEYKHARWSQEWFDYCDKLIAENNNLRRFESYNV